MQKKTLTKMTKDLKKMISAVPALEMSVLPTTVHRLDRLSELLGTDIHCKRDDLTGFAFGGNKVRKLDYLVKDALLKGADSLVTFGSNQSNWCRMTSVAGAVNELEVFLVLEGSRPDKPTANLLLDHMAGARVTHVESTTDDAVEKAARQLADDLAREGRKPYYMAVGGSNGRGSLGYVRAFLEVLEHEEKHQMRFDNIIVASGSAGTQAGLVAGKLLSGWPGKITGITVSRDRVTQANRILKIVQETLEILQVSVEESRIRQAIVTNDDYLGEGYRINTQECLEAIDIFIKKEGIFLDEVYTGKAAAGLIGLARAGTITPHERTLFFHTGGNVQLFE